MKNYKLLLTSTMLSASVMLASCGTLLYPERQGQSRGNIDPAIAILNGVGLLFFVIPGLVAFGIDFHTGAIYLPNSSANLNEKETNPKTRHENAYRQIGELKQFSKNELEDIIKLHTGLDKCLDHPDLVIIDTSTNNQVDYKTYASLKHL